MAASVPASTETSEMAMMGMSTLKTTEAEARRISILKETWRCRGDVGRCRGDIGEIWGDVGRCRGDVGEMWGYVGRSWEIYGASRCGRGDGENLRVIGGYLWHLELARLVVDGGAEHLVRVRARARARARVRARARARG